MIDNRLTTRKRRICYINSDPKTLETSVAFFEKRLKLLSDLEIINLPSLEKIAFSACDLIIINCAFLSDEAFMQWFPKTSEKITKQLNISVPTIFLARIDFAILDKMWQSAYQSNWYFDIIHPEHLESLPIRVATLLRIHDHLHEMQRYELEIGLLKKEVVDIQQKLEKFLAR